MFSKEAGITKLLEHASRQVTLTNEDKNLVAAHFTIREITKRQLLLTAGNICRYEYFVVKGFFRMFYTDQQIVEHTLRFAAENWWISDVDSFLHGRPSAYSIEALEQSVVLQIDKGSLELLFRELPLFERYFRMLHQNAFIALSNRILSGISEDGRTRYLAFRETFPGWDQRIPQKYIASYLGITPVFLSRIRKMLSQENKK